MTTALPELPGDTLLGVPGPPIAVPDVEPDDPFEVLDDDEEPEPEPEPSD